MSAEQVPAERLAALRLMSAAMAEDDGLWFIPKTAPEAYLQQELRKLCAAIECAAPPPALGEAVEAAKWIVAEMPNHTRAHFVARAFLALLTTRGDGWQDIETAPKGGTPIILGYKNRQATIGYAFANVHGWYCEVDDSLLPEPRAWQPLPFPPKTGS